MNKKNLMWIKRKWFIFLYKHNKPGKPIRVKQNRQLGLTTFVTNEALKVGGLLVVDSINTKRWLTQWYYTHGNNINGTSFTKEEISNHIISSHEYNQCIRGRRPGTKVFLDNSIRYDWYNNNKQNFIVPIYNGFVSN